MTRLFRYQTRKVKNSSEASNLTDEWLLAQILQHRMVFEIKPVAENLETAVLWPEGQESFSFTLISNYTVVPFEKLLQRT
jgi:hypothetical protein